MLNRLCNIFVQTREGVIVFGASLFYIVIWLITNFMPSFTLVPGFVILMAPYMPFFLLLFFLRIGGFKRNFQSGWFNSVMILIVACVPFITLIQAEMSR